jgi:hypothetical protein
MKQITRKEAIQKILYFKPDYNDLARMMFNNLSNEDILDELHLQLIQDKKPLEKYKITQENCLK